ncbi:hypothetical protein C7T96_07195 [Nitratireductor sp. StC3]|nr:hypothetical protein C7T96_07195 [Nitratireductor sp. StC3]
MCGPAGKNNGARAAEGQGPPRAAIRRRGGATWPVGAGGAGLEPGRAQALNCGGIRIEYPGKKYIFQPIACISGQE